MHHKRFLLTSCAAVVLLCGRLGNAGDPGEVLKRADEAWVAGHIPQAEALFRSAVQQYPASVEAKMRLAGFLLGNQRYGDTVQTYRAVVGDGSAEPVVQAKAFVGMGVAYLHAGNRPLARASFQQAIELDPAREEQLRPLLADLETID
jgi:cytochrome c-type biogenesis protein CcmH/NrfG